MLFYYSQVTSYQGEIEGRIPQIDPGVSPPGSGTVAARNVQKGQPYYAKYSALRQLGHREVFSTQRCLEPCGAMASKSHHSTLQSG